MTIQSEANKYYIDKFEQHFSDWVESLSAVIASGGDLALLKSPVQALVNAYCEKNGSLSPVQIPKFNTLKFFIIVSGASDQHSGKNESLEILTSAIKLGNSNFGNI